MSGIRLGVRHPTDLVLAALPIGFAIGYRATITTVDASTIN
jgi:hypothetical protein